VPVAHQPYDDRVQVLGMAANEILEGLAVARLCSRDELSVLVGHAGARHRARWLAGIGDSFAAGADRVATGRRKDAT
jgi:hypothetical protein